MTAPSDLNEQILVAHRTIEAFKFAFARRTELADPKFVNITEVSQIRSTQSYMN